jgi:hypothetical protein
VTGDVAPLLAVACWSAVLFILGTWYGLYLNLSHWHRMRQWAEKAADAAASLSERANQ